MTKITIRRGMELETIDGYMIIGAYNGSIVEAVRIILDEDGEEVEVTDARYTPDEIARLLREYFGTPYHVEYGSRTVLDKYGDEVDFDEAVEQMDDNLRLGLDSVTKNVTNQDYFEQYAWEHELHHHEPFGPWEGLLD